MTNHTPNHQSEVERNFAAFKSLLPTLTGEYGKYALLHAGELKAVYDTFEDALKTAEAFYKDGMYSIQRVTDKPVDLGFRSRALHRR